MQKVGQKISALNRVSRYMITEKIRILFKYFFESQFAYFSLVWMFHNRDLEHKINKLHERALRTVYNNDNLSFSELLARDNSFTIYHKNIQTLAIGIYKCIHDLSPSFMAIYKILCSSSLGPFEKFKKEIKSWKPSECSCRLCKNCIRGVDYVNSSRHN